MPLPADDHGGRYSFAEVAPRILQQARAAVQQAAAEMGAQAVVTSAAALPGCVHVLLEVALRPAAAAGREEMERQMDAFEAAMRRALQEGLQAEGLQAEGLQAEGLQLQLMDAAAPAAGDAGSWQQLPWAALASPVCLQAAAADGDEAAAAYEANPQSVMMGVVGGAATQQLPAQPRVAVTGLQQPAPAGPAGMDSFSQVLGSAQVWAPPAAAEGRRHLSITLASCPVRPAALVLYLLPAQGAAGAAAHPLASLPLLCLPPAAAHEVLQLYSRMVGEAAAGDAEGASDEASAARRAYWGHFVPFAADWRALLAAATAAGQQQREEQQAGGGAAGVLHAQLVRACDLVSFLESQGMAACLEVAAGLVARGGLEAALQQACAGVAAQPAAAASEAQEPAAVPAATVVAPAGATAAHGSAQPPPAAAAAPGTPTRPSSRPAAEASSTKQQHQSPQHGKSAAGASSSSAADEQAAPTTTSHSAPAPAALTWRATLLGFPDAATEAAYLSFKNARCLALFDIWGAPLSLGIYLAWATPLLLRGAWEPIFVVGALFNLPYAVMLLWRRWYLEHREALLVVLGGAGRVVNAFGYGLLSLWSGVDRCTSMPMHALLALALGCALQLPLMQQVRLRPAALLTGVDALGVGCYAAFRSGSALVGAGAGVAAGLAGLAVSVTLERRSRSVFARQQQQGA